MIDLMPNLTGMTGKDLRRVIALVMLISALTVLGSCAPDENPGSVKGATSSTETALEALPTLDEAESGPVGTPGVQDPTATAVETPTKAVPCMQGNGQIQRIEYSSNLLGAYIPVMVYLPPCYSEAQEYPALYLLHGKPQDENHWLILGVEQVINKMIYSGELGGVVLIMPEQPEPLFSQTDGGPGSYEGEFLLALMPFVESRLAISADPDQRAIAGISRGGVWALEIAFTNPELFSGAAALSPALNVNEAREAYDPLHLASNAPVLPENIFLGSGDVDSAAAETEELHHILMQRGRSHRYTTVPGGHEGGTWQQLLGEMLDYLTQDW